MSHLVEAARVLAAASVCVILVSAGLMSQLVDFIPDDLLFRIVIFTSSSFVAGLLSRELSHALMSSILAVSIIPIVLGYIVTLPLAHGYFSETSGYFISVTLTWLAKTALVMIAALPIGAIIGFFSREFGL